MKNGWNLCTLGNTFATVTGSTPSKSKTEFYGDDIPFVKPPELLDSQVENSKDSLSEEGRRVARVAPSGSILISCIGNLGKIGIAKRDVAFNQQINAILPDQSKAHPKFMFYQALSPLFRSQLDSLATGTTVSIVNKSRFNSIEVVLPPLDEQKRIVSILDQAFEGLDRARANAEANLDSARELFQSVMSNSFADPSIEWNVADLGSLGKIVTGSTPKRADKDCFGDHIPFIKPGDFREDGSLTYENEGLSKKGENISRVSPAGSALMVCIGATIGKAGYTEQAITTNQQINSIIPRPGVNGKYLYLQMLSSDFQAQVMHGSGQATLPIINKSKWSKLRIRIPGNLNHQNAIVEQLFDIRTLIEKLKIRLHETQIDISSLRQSLLHKAFSGELT